MNNYKDLSNDYFTQSKRIKNYISYLRGHLEDPLTHKEYKALTNRISTLYDMSLELNHVGEYLSLMEGRDNFAH